LPILKSGNHLPFISWELFMNKSVLPMSLDSVSFDSPSLSKPIKKTVVETDTRDKRDSFAEHLSQSRRELAPDKRANNTREKISVDRSQSRIAAEHQSDTQHALNEKVTDTCDLASNHQVTVKADEPNQDDLQNSDQEFAEDTVLIPVATDPVLLNSEQNVSMTPTSVDAAAVITDTDLLVVTEGSIEAEFEMQKPLDAEIAIPLVETDEVLIIKGDDLNGIDSQPSQMIVDVEEIVIPVDDLSKITQPEIAKANTIETSTTQLNVPVGVVDQKLAGSASIVTPSSEVVTNKTGIELPLALPQGGTTEGDGKETLDPNTDLTALTGEIKQEDKSTKTELFKSLLAQVHSEKPALVNEKSVAEPGLPTLTASTSSQVATANRLFVPQTQLGMNFVHPHWGNAVGEKILWMANQQLSTADIRLDPPELGSLQVRVNVQQDQANITFISPHPQVRELLDQQVTRLREMFAEQGLQLGHVDIADRREQESRHSNDESKSKGRLMGEESEEVQVTAISSLYLVDQFV
jgi:flagellar hook-length control protein FliK